MAKKDKKVIKVKTATVGKSFDTKKVDSDIEFLKTKLLKGKKGENISDIGADILKRNKAKKPVEDDGLSDMARMILANKNKEEIETEAVEEVEETETEAEEEIIEDTIEDTIEKVVEDIVEETETETFTVEEDELEEIIEEVESELDEVIEEIEEEIIEDIIEEVEETETETEIESEMNEIIEETIEKEDEPEEEVVDETIEKVVEDIVEDTETETEEEIDKVVMEIIPEIIPEIKPEPEVIEEPEVKTEIVIEGVKTDVRKFEVESEDDSSFQVYNYVDTHVYVRIFEKLENKSSFRLHIPKSTPRYQFYIDVTSSEFFIKHKNNILFDFHSYSGHIDFTPQGMILNCKLYPYQMLEFVKM